MYELKVIDHFAAAHQLKMVSEKCENLHGHNWKVEVHIKGETLSKAGVLLDFGELKEHVTRIMAALDHKFLNELDMFEDMPPSSENIARYVTDEVQSCIKGASAKVSKVTVWESENACATYTP